jgi:hypothetical protein
MEWYMHNFYSWKGNYLQHVFDAHTLSYKKHIIDGRHEKVVPTGFLYDSFTMVSVPSRATLLQLYGIYFHYGWFYLFGST